MQQLSSPEPYCFELVNISKGFLDQSGLYLTDLKGTDFLRGERGGGRPAVKLASDRTRTGDSRVET